MIWHFFILIGIYRSWCPSGRKSNNCIPEKVGSVIQAPSPNRSRTMSGSYYFKTNKVLCIQSHPNTYLISNVNWPTSIKACMSVIIIAIEVLQNKSVLTSYLSQQFKYMIFHKFICILCMYLLRIYSGTYNVTSVQLAW